MDNINVYVGTDGKIHFVDKDGADSVLNFSSKKPIRVAISSTYRTDGAKTVISATLYYNNVAIASDSRTINYYSNTSFNLNG